VHWSSSVSAKTYTLKSGKWTDPATWNDNYPGTTIRADDVVIIEGAILINTSIVVEGTLWVARGASMVGFRDLRIASSGQFINNGNTVMERIVNEGRIVNNQSMDAITDIDNKGTIQNTSNLVAGNDFNNTSGVVTGEKSTLFAQNNIITSPDSKIGPGVRGFYGNAIEKSKDSASVSQEIPVKDADNQSEVNRILQMQHSSELPK